MAWAAQQSRRGGFSPFYSQVALFSTLHVTLVPSAPEPRVSGSVCPELRGPGVWLGQMSPSQLAFLDLQGTKCGPGCCHGNHASFIDGLRTHRSKGGEQFTGFPLGGPPGRRLCPRAILGPGWGMGRGRGWGGASIHAFCFLPPSCFCS